MGFAYTTKGWCHPIAPLARGGAMSHDPARPPQTLHRLGPGIDAEVMRGIRVCLRSTFESGTLRFSVRYRPVCWTKYRIIGLQPANRCGTIVSTLSLIRRTIPRKEHDMNNQTHTFRGGNGPVHGAQTQERRRLGCR